MVARTENGSIFGIPPAPVAPEATRENNAGSLSPEITSVTNPVAQPPPEAQVVVADGRTLGIFAGDAEDEGEDMAVQSPTRNTVVDANSPHWMSHARSSGGRQESRSTNTADALACHQDEKTWQMWHEQELPTAFSQLIPKCERRCLVCKSSMIYYKVQEQP